MHLNIVAANTKLSIFVVLCITLNIVQSTTNKKSGALAPLKFLAMEYSG